MSEDILKLCWKNHSSEFIPKLSALCSLDKYTDVTLACGGQFYQSHKLILSTYSDYFLRIFDSTSCKHPVIVLRDVAGRDMTALLGYMYNGKVTVTRSELPSLIKVAKHLQIRGFSLSEDQLPTPKKKRPMEEEGFRRQMHKRPRKVKQEMTEEMMTMKGVPVEDLILREDEVGDIIGSSVPVPEEEVMVESVLEEEEGEEPQTHIQIDLMSDSEHSHLDHNVITLSTQKQHQQHISQESTTTFRRIKKELLSDFEYQHVNLTEAESMHKKQMVDMAKHLASSQKSVTMTREKHQAILAHLRNPTDMVSPKFRHWVKIRRFCIMDLPEMGLTGVLAIPDRDARVTGSLKPQRYLHVVSADAAFDILYRTHNQKLNHAGYKRVLQYLHRHYFGITRSFVQTFCKTCPTCAARNTQLHLPQ